MPISQSLCLVCSRLLPPFESNYKGSKVCTATNPFSHKIKTTYSSRLFFVLVDEFGQLVAPRQTCLRSEMSVGELLRNYKSCAYSRKSK